MNSFLLKIFACISMFIDHAGYIVFGNSSWFNYIGRFSFPIFAFQLAQGYTHTKNLKKYFFRLIIFAIISQIPFMLFCSIFSDNFSLNIIFTLIFGLLFITVYDKFNKIVGALLGIVLAVLAQVFKFDYGWYGIAIIMSFYIFKEHKILMTSSFILLTFAKYIVPIIHTDFKFIVTALFTINQYSLLCFFSILSITFILSYNGKKGKDSKYLMYLFYPIHLFLLYIINMII